uniref:Uncharacterized protein n=1 Tax=Glossina pallidipes TaxID=7398 RepID=A0A1A9ZE83_GLOPL
MDLLNNYPKYGSFANIGSSSDNFGSKTVKFIRILHIDMIAKRAFCISANCSGVGFGSGSFIRLRRSARGIGGRL